MPPLGLMGLLDGSISAPESQLWTPVFLDPISLATNTTHSEANTDIVLRIIAINLYHNQ